MASTIPNARGTMLTTVVFNKWPDQTDMRKTLFFRRGCLLCITRIALR